MRVAEVEKAREEAARMLNEAGIILPRDAEIEITDFGQDDFYRIGLALVIRVDEPEYASKWLVVFPGQLCPAHSHEKIKETFFLMRGDVKLWLGENQQVVELNPGESVTLEPNTDHAFTSAEGAIIEEVTNRQYKEDSIFRDPEIVRWATLEQ